MLIKSLYACDKKFICIVDTYRSLTFKNKIKNRRNVKIIFFTILNRVFHKLQNVSVLIKKLYYKVFQF